MSMGSVRHMVGAGVVAAGLLTGGTAGAAVQITVPACDAGLNAWAATVNPAETYNVAPALPLPAALGDESMIPVFGLGVLDWTLEDVKAASNAMVACYKTAKAAGDKPTMDALGVANGAVAKTLGKTLGWLDRVKAEIDKQKAAIEALPDSRELDLALGALVNADPAAPDLNSTRGLPREVVTPAWALAKVLPSIPDADREALFAAFALRRTAMQGSMTDGLNAAVAAAPETADGVIAILQARQGVASVTGNEAVTAADAAAAERAEAIRTTLRAASPAGWVTPSCEDYYRWGGAAGTQDNVYLGSQGTLGLFLDERVVPVFGIPVAAWTDEDVTRYLALRDVCAATWQALPGAAAVASLPADAPELLKLASAGAWIDRIDQHVTQARTTLQAYATAKQALDAVQAQVAALPDTQDSLIMLQQLANDPSQQGVDEASRQAFQTAVVAKQQSIEQARMAQAMEATQAAMDGLNALEVNGPADLVKVVVFANNALGTIPDQNGQQAFINAYDQAMQAAVAKVMPEFTDKLAEMPATMDGLWQARTAVNDLTGVTDSEQVPVFQPLHNAVFDREKAMLDTMRKDNCEALLDELDIDSGDAEELVWDGNEGMTLGTFVCNLTAGGSPVAEYDGGVMMSDASLKVDLGAMGGLQTMTLHEAEVAAGKEMLVGYQSEDANGQEKPIAVQEWAVFTAMAAGGGGRFVTQEICDPVLGKAEDDRTVEERMIAVDCAVEIIQGNVQEP